MPESTYAVVKTGGKQYRVEQGSSLLVELLTADVGATIELEPIMLSGKKALIGADELAKVKVEAKVIGHERGPKLRIFKFKPKRGYKRRTGHRQDLTRIEITRISEAGASGTAAAKSQTKSKESEDGS